MNSGERSGENPIREENMVTKFNLTSVNQNNVRCQWCQNGVISVSEKSDTDADMRCHNRCRTSIVSIVLN